MLPDPNDKNINELITKKGNNSTVDVPRLMNPEPVRAKTFSWIRNCLFRIRKLEEKKQIPVNNQNYTLFCFNCTENTVECSCKVKWFLIDYKAFSYNILTYLKKLGINHSGFKNTGCFSDSCKGREQGQYRYLPNS